MTPLYGQDVVVAAWVAARIGQPILPPFTAIGWLSAGRLAAGAVFNDYTGANIEITVAADRLSPGMIQTCARYVFRQLACRRLTLRTRRRNRHVCNLARRLGFTYEATLRRYFVEDDAVLFVMQRETCRWLT